MFGLGSLCRVLYVPSSLSLCSSVRPEGGGPGSVGEGEAAVPMGRRLRRSWVIYSESDDSDVVVQNALSLGALGKNHIIHFYSSACCTDSFVGGGRRF